MGQTVRTCVDDDQLDERVCLCREAAVECTLVEKMPEGR